MFRMDMLGTVTIILTSMAAIAFKGKVTAAAAGKFDQIGDLGAYYLLYHVRFGLFDMFISIYQPYLFH